MAQEAHSGESHGLNPRQYVTIFVVLTVITVIELAISYSGLAKVGLIAILFPLSALKFGIVVALFMHLRFDSPFFAKMFLGPLLLASGVLLALLILGEYDAESARSVIFRFRGE
jgi:heme/copper-type cytochrome/quinol oxidase subunit 4